jgi:hypothetical protein
MQCGGDGANYVAAKHDRYAAGNDTVGTNFTSPGGPAGHDHSDDWRSESGSCGEEDE